MPNIQGKNRKISMKKRIIALSILLFCTALQAMENQSLINEQTNLKSEIIALLNQRQPIESAIKEYTIAAKSAAPSQKLKHYLKIQEYHQQLFENAQECLDKQKRIQEIVSQVSPSQKYNDTLNDIREGCEKDNLFARQNTIFAELKINTHYLKTIKKELEVTLINEKVVSLAKINNSIQGVKASQETESKQSLATLPSNLSEALNNCNTSLEAVYNAQKLLDEFSTTTKVINITDECEINKKLIQTYTHSIQDLKKFFESYTPQN